MGLLFSRKIRRIILLDDTGPDERDEILENYKAQYSLRKCENFVPLLDCFGYQNEIHLIFQYCEVPYTTINNNDYTQRRHVHLHKVKFRPYFTTIFIHVYTNNILQDLCTNLDY